MNWTEKEGEREGGREGGRGGEREREIEKNKLCLLAEQRERGGR